MLKATWPALGRSFGSAERVRALAINMAASVVAGLSRSRSSSRRFWRTAGLDRVWVCLDWREAILIPTDGPLSSGMNGCVAKDGESTCFRLLIGVTAHGRV